jgi:hypothetical protein
MILGRSDDATTLAGGRALEARRQALMRELAKIHRQITEAEMARPCSSSESAVLRSSDRRLDEMPISPAGRALMARAVQSGAGSAVLQLVVVGQMKDIGSAACGVHYFRCSVP